MWLQGVRQCMALQRLVGSSADLTGRESDHDYNDYYYNVRAQMVRLPCAQCNAHAKYVLM